MANRATQMRYSNIPELKEFVLNDIHRTGKNLGHGAFGVVEELRIGSSGTFCAGKRLHSELLNNYHDPEQESIQRTARRFIAECKLMARVRHPRIVEFMGVCFFDDSPYPILVMEKLDVDFESFLGRYDSIPFPVILHILQDIIEGLVYLHGQRPPIIHRDLTARNILIHQSSLRAKITDLGSARLSTDDHSTFTNTISRCPGGALCYMPPEALSNSPTFDHRFDMFSFGHLSLFAVIRENPKDLEAPVYYEKGILKGRNEVERREKYIKKLDAKLTKDHVVTKMILQCLEILPKNRPTAKQVMEQLISVSMTEDDAYSLHSVDLVGLINQVDKGESITVGNQSLKRRIDNFKNGAPGVLDIRVSGKLLRRQTWRTHVFQIKDGALNCFRQEMMDRLYDSLNLSSIVYVKVCLPKKAWNKSMFYFEVHFSDFLDSPSMWQLRAYTQDDRICWMEAISAGSTGILLSHEISTPATEGTRMLGPSDDQHIQGSTSADYEDLYDYAYVRTDSKIRASGQSQPVTPISEGAATHAHSKSSSKSATVWTRRVVSGNQTPQSLPQTSLLQDLGHGGMMISSQDKDLHAINDDATANTDSEITKIYENVRQSIPPLPVKDPQRIEPNELSALSDHLSSINPREGLLWLLDQMHNLVVKFVGEYESSTVESPLLSKPQLSAQEIKMETPMLAPPVPPRDRSLCPVQKAYEEKTSVSISCRSNMAYSENKAPLPTASNTPQKEGHIGLTLLQCHLPVADSDYLETQSSQLTVSENVLFIPRSALSENMEEIGHGQFGKIFKGIYRRSEKEELPVAIKTAKKHTPGSDFQQEMAIMSTLSHQNIVHFYGLVEQIAEQPWIVLEFLTHGNLKTFLTKNKQPVHKLVKYMLDVATGMQYISENGFIHRDLTARNIMVSQDEICKVSDFSLLQEIPKDADRSTMSYISNTKKNFPIRWMAPESHVRREFSPASDVWSFGIVMWEMHNPTEQPYKGLSNIEVVANICMGMRLEIPKLYPTPVMKIMNACWQLEPSKRPSFLLITMQLTNVVFGTN